MQFKKDPRLLAMASLISNRMPETVVEANGAKFRLRMLKPEGDVWVAMQNPSQNRLGAMANLKTLSIAAALVSIDYGDESGEATVEQLFQVDDATPADKEFYATNPKALQDLRRSAVLEYLLTSVDSVTIDTLYNAYSNMLSTYAEQAEKGFT